MLPLYLGLYALGVLGGLAASAVFDLQLRRPGLRQAILLVGFVVLVVGATRVTDTRFTDLLLPLVWVGTGTIAGLGSRRSQANA